MRRFRSCVGWGLAIALLMLSPVILIFSLPVAIGIGLDVMGRHGELPVALALCGPVALVVLARALPREALRHPIRARSGARRAAGQPTLR